MPGLEDIAEGDDLGSYRVTKRMRIKDWKFGDWYRKEGHRMIEQLYADEEAVRINEIKKDLPGKEHEFKRAGGEELSVEEIRVQPLQLHSIPFEHVTSEAEKKLLDELVRKGCLTTEGLFKKSYIIIIAPTPSFNFLCYFPRLQ